MSNLKYISDCKTTNVGKILLYMFAIALYLPMIFTNIITILLIIFTLTNYKKLNFKLIFRNSSFTYLLILYVVILLGFFYDIAVKGVLNDLEKKLSFIIFPIVIFAMNLTKTDFKRIISLFFFAGFSFTTIALLIALFNMGDQVDFKLLTHHDLSLNIGLHATYLSMYLLFSLIFPIRYYKEIANSKLKCLIIFLTGFIIVYILLLSVRMIWLLLSISFVLYLVANLKSKKILWRDAVIYLSVAIIIGVLTIYSFSPLRERFKEAINYNNQFNVDKVWGGRGIRILIWENCFSLISKQPLVGYGSSKEVQDQLNTMYNENNVGQLLYMMRNDAEIFNPHNQFLEEILKFGLILGLLFPLFLFIELKRFLKDKRMDGVFFIIIVIGVSITETILELNKGILFFSFFYALIKVHDIQNKKSMILNTSDIVV